LSRRTPGPSAVRATGGTRVLMSLVSSRCLSWQTYGRCHEPGVTPGSDRSHRPDDQVQAPRSTLPTAWTAGEGAERSLSRRPKCAHDEVVIYPASSETPIFRCRRLKPARGRCIPGLLREAFVASRIAGRGQSDAQRQPHLRRKPQSNMIATRSSLQSLGSHESAEQAAVPKSEITMGRRSSRALEAPQGITVTAQRRNRDTRSCLLVASSGGHLLQLHRIAGSLPDVQRTWVTFRAPDAVSLLAQEEVVFAFSPTNRHLRNLMRNLGLAWTLIEKERPRIVISTGAGVGVPFCWIGRLFGARIIFVDSLTRVTGPSLSGRLVAPIAHRYLVQWEELASRHRKAEYFGGVI
jgi:beta-1,4-N-acetylglucosaminyltransferase